MKRLFAGTVVILILGAFTACGGDQASGLKSVCREWATTERVHEGSFYVTYRDLLPRMEQASLDFETPSPSDDDKVNFAAARLRIASSGFSDWHGVAALEGDLDRECSPFATIDVGPATPADTFLGAVAVQCAKFVDSPNVGVLKGNVDEAMRSINFVSGEQKLSVHDAQQLLAAGCPTIVEAAGKVASTPLPEPRELSWEQVCREVAMAFGRTKICG